MNQTAVQWLEEQLDNLLELYPSEIQKVNGVLQQAKKIEKQQIIDAYNSGQQKEAKQNFWTKGELYYNETFKKTTKQ